jgi:hypothetical protein
MRSIEQVQDEVQKLAGEGEQRNHAEFEAELWSAMLAFGRTLVELFLVVHVARPRATEYRHGGGRRWKLGKNRQTSLGVRFGKVVFDRPTGRDVTDERAAGDLPVDRELGLGSGFSLGAVVAVTGYSGAELARLRPDHASSPRSRWCATASTPPRQRPVRTEGLFGSTANLQGNLRMGSEPKGRAANGRFGWTGGADILGAGACAGGRSSRSMPRARRCSRRRPIGGGRARMRRAAAPSVRRRGRSAAGGRASGGQGG